MSDKDPIFELAERAVYGKFNPADVEALKNTPGAKEYLIQNLPINEKFNDTIGGAYHRTSIIAEVLGEIGEPKDAAHLNEALQVAFIHKLKLASQVTVVGALAELSVGTGQREGMALAFNSSEMIKTIVDGTVDNIFEAMVKLGAKAQALEIVEKIKKLSLTNSQKEDMLEFDRTARNIIQAHARLKNIAVSNMKRTPVDGAKNQKGRIAQ